MTALIVLTACLYAWIRARHVPEMVCTAERNKTMSVWNENEGVWEVSTGCTEVKRGMELIQTTYLQFHRP